MISEVWRYVISAFCMPHPVDIHVGKRLIAFRVRDGLSSADLAGLLSVPQRHIECFETGRRRLSARHLFIVARHLDVSVADFFDQREATV